MSASGWEDACANLGSGWDEVLEDTFGNLASEDHMLVSSDVASTGRHERMSKEEMLKVQVGKVLDEFHSTLSAVLHCPLHALLDDVIAHQLETTAMHETTQKAIDMASIAQHFFSQGVKLHASKASRAMILGVDASAIEPSLGMLSSIVLHLEKQYRMRLEEHVCNCGGELLMYVDLARYDETPMKVTVDQATDELLPVGLSGSPAQGDEHKSKLHASACGMHTKTTMTSKLFSSEHEFAMLVKVPLESDSGLEHKVVLLKSSLLSFNQLLGKKATGMVLAKALLQSGKPSEHADKFMLKVRIASTDAAASNIACERLVMETRDEQWSSLQVFCVVHVAARILTKTMALVDEDVSGMLNYALSLNGAGSTLEFRKALAAVVMKRPFVIHRGLPPLEVVEHNRFIISLFGSTGTRVAERQAILGRVCTGDWRNKVAIEIYVPVGFRADETLLRQQYLQYVVWVLCHKGYSAYPKHRWLGADTSIDEVCLGLALHNIAGEAYQLMCNVTQQSDDVGTIGLELAMPASSELIGHISTSIASDGVANASHEADDHDDRMPGEIGMIDGGLFADEAVSSDRGVTMATENAVMRKKVLAWLAANPLGKCMIVRLVMKPLMMLLRGYIARSGLDGESSSPATLQSMEEASDVADNGENLSALERYVALIDENRFFTNLSSVLSNDDWKHLPEECLNLQKQALAFKLSSKAGSLVYELLVCPTKLAPLSIFRILHDRGHAEYLQQVQPTCLQDNFTASMLKRFPGEKFIGEDCLTCLKVLAQAPVETVQIECGHGKTHRLITHASVQTHTPKLAYINSQVLGQKYCHRVRSCKPWAPQVRRAICKRSIAEASAEPSMSKKGGHGGVQRAFVSLMTKGKKGTPNFKALGALFQEHRQANSEVFQEAMRKGKLATAKAKANQGAFAPPLRDLRRRQARAANKVIPLAHNASTSLVVHGSADGSQGVHHMSDMDCHLQKVRAQAKAAATKSRLEKGVIKHSLQEFAEGCGQDSVDKLVQAIPELMPFADCLHAIPWKNHQAVKCVFQHLEDAIHVANFAQAQSHASDLGKALLADWQRVNKAIDSSASLPEGKSERVGMSKCLKQGYCTCQGEGKQVGKFRTEFYKVLKRVCPRGVAEKKQLLASGCIVVAFKGEAEKRLLSSGWDDACEELCIEEDGQALHTSGTHWAHIGAQYFKPYRSSLQLLEYVGAKGDQHILQQSGVFKTLFEFVGTLSLQSKWSVEFWQILESLEPVHAFDPRVCVVKKFAGNEELWGQKNPKKTSKS
eukprot:4162385-Amphidinium_carterae.1